MAPECCKSRQAAGMLRTTREPGGIREQGQGPTGGSVVTVVTLCSSWDQLLLSSRGRFWCQLCSSRASLQPQVISFT